MAAWFYSKRHQILTSKRTPPSNTWILKKSQTPCFLPHVAPHSYHLPPLTSPSLFTSQSASNATEMGSDKENFWRMRLAGWLLKGEGTEEIFPNGRPVSSFRTALLTIQGLGDYASKLYLFLFFWLVYIHIGHLKCVSLWLDFPFQFPRCSLASQQTKPAPIYLFSNYITLVTEQSFALYIYSQLECQDCRFDRTRDRFRCTKFISKKKRKRRCFFFLYC